MKKIISIFLAILLPTILWSVPYTNSYITKPPPGSRINRMNPLTKGLVSCFILNEGAGGVINDLASGGQAVNTKVSGSLWTHGAMGTEISNLTNGSQDNYFVENFGRIAFPATIIAIFTDHSIASLNGSSIGSNDNSGATGGFALGFTAASPTVMQIILDNVGHTAFSNLTIASTNNDQYYFGAISIIGTTATGYLGKLKQSLLTQTVTGIGAQSAGANAISIFTQNSGIGVGIPGQGKLVYLLFYNRNLSANEIQSLYQEPYQFMVPAPSDRFWTPSSSIVPPIIETTIRGMVIYTKTMFSGASTVK